MTGSPARPAGRAPTQVGPPAGRWLWLAWAVALGVTVGAVALIAPAAASTGPGVHGRAVPAGPAPAAVLAAPASTASGPVQLRVDPATDLNRAGSEITVSGSGFNAGTPLLVAVCADDGAAPKSLDKCMGGSVPAGNPSKAWGFISADGKPGPAQSQKGGVPAAFGPGGGFSVKLTLPAASGSDCLAGRCAVFTRAVDGGTDGALSIPVTFAVAPTTPATAPTTPATSSSQPPSTAPSSTQPPISISSVPQPSTLAPKTIRDETLAAGANQQISFLGFTPNEKVTVLLFSDPIPLPSRRADGDGFVRIDFTVPKTLAPGTHVLQATGQSSKNTGIARFVVTAPPPPTSATPTTTALPSTTASSSTTVSSTASAPVPVPVSSSAASSAASSALVAPPVTAAPTTTSGSRPVWPWFVLGGLILLLIAAAVLIWGRRSRRLEEDNTERERLLAQAAQAEHMRAVSALGQAEAAAPTSYIPPYAGGVGAAGADRGDPYADPYADRGLLSGRDHPDSPPLLSGQDWGQSWSGGADAPTERSGTGGEPNRPPLGIGDWRPAGDDPSGPADPPRPAAPASDDPYTAAWRPDFTGPSQAATPADEVPGRHAAPVDDQGSSSAVEPDPPTQQWRPDRHPDPDPQDDPPAGGRQGA